MCGFLYIWRVIWSHSATKLWWSIGRTDCLHYSTRVDLYCHQILLMWTQSSYLMANPYLSVKWELSNSPWNLHLRYRLPIAQSWRLTESVKLCVLQGRTDDYSSWLCGQCWIQYHCQELMYIINQEKTPLQMDFTAAMLSLSLYRIILPHLCF